MSLSLPVNEDDGKDGGSNIDGTNDGSVEQGSVLAVTKHVKELGGVEHDGVDTRELLEEGNQDRTNLQHTRRVYMCAFEHPILCVQKCLMFAQQRHRTQT